MESYKSTRGMVSELSAGLALTTLMLLSLAKILALNMGEHYPQVGDVYILWMIHFKDEYTF